MSLERDIKEIMEADIFKAASQEELEARSKIKWWIVELVPHDPFLAIHPCGVCTMDKAQEMAEELSTSESSWIVVDEPTLREYRKKLNALEI
jgi:hypothetical protein